MARQVFMHIGAPKTGTTFLQTIMWENRSTLREQGLLYPGDTRMDHFQATMDVRRPPRDDSVWERLVFDIERWPDTGLITHEFFTLASAQQAQRAVERLAPAEVHVVFTARDLIRQFPAVWQEALKMGSRLTFDEFMDRALAFNLPGPWGWKTQDMAAILQRWASAVAPERVHVITVPRPGAPRDVLWRRWCQVVGIDPDGFDLDVAFSNESLGVGQAALLHRVNQHATDDFTEHRHRHRWLRQYFGHEVLVPQGGERFGVRVHHAQELQRLSEKAVAVIAAGGFDIVGDLDELLGDVPSADPPNPDDVSETEVVEIAAVALEQMIRDQWRMTEQRDRWHRRARETAAHAKASNPTVRGAVRHGFRWLADRIARRRTPG